MKQQAKHKKMQEAMHNKQLSALSKDVYLEIRDKQLNDQSEEDNLKKFMNNVD